METAWANEASSSSSCSSSSNSTQFKYDVFLSFSGVDTRNNFTSHLLAALERHGFHTFRDDTKLNRGEYIGDELLKAIEGSRISLVVFSKSYAASRWCLDELVKIMECKKTLQQIVLPIFYNVEPSDVRAQRGSLAEAFAKHEERLKDCSDGRVKKWREALTEVANLSGWDLPKVANGDEAHLIRKVIEEVQNKLDHVHLYVACHEIGLESRIQKLKLLLKMESDDVRIVAVWGMGGIGKTTLVKKLYNLIQHKFEGSCFLANIRETSKQPNGLVVLQEQLLSDILRTGAHNLRNFHQGIEVIKRRAFCRKVLLILDDVDDVQQLKALAIDQDSFGFGSTVIITTRDISSLNLLKVDEIYVAKELNKDESLELFKWHSFKEDHPTEDYFDLSGQVVYYAGGLPLALEILGSFLRGKSIPEWKSAIAKLRKIPDYKIQGILKISFDSLSKEVQELFLDMACFFVGTGRDFTVKILEGRNLFAEIGIRVLADQCLLKYHGNELVMHDMVRDMGREIVRQESLEDPGKRSRLWHLDDVLEVLRYGTGTEAVKGLLLNTIDVQVNAKPFEKMDKLWYHKSVLEVRRDTMGTEEVENCLLNSNDPEHVQVNAKAFEKMNNLWLLHLDYVHQTADFEHASRRLLWLSWKGFPLECLPWNLSMEKLIALDLRYSSLKKVWNGNKILDKLKFLYLSHCHYLTRTPDFSGLNSLEELLLNDCESLVEVDESIRCLNKLLVLDMRNCTKLQKLPSGIWMLKSLEYLNLSGCSKLGNLAVFKGPLNKLWCLFFSSWTLPPKGVNSIGFSLTSVQAFGCLKELWMANCSLSYLPDEIGRLISLETFIIRGNCLSTLPDGIGNLSCLKTLHVFENKLSHLPSGIGNLMSLDSLVLECESLLTLPDNFCSLTRLEFFYVNRCNLSHLPSEIGNLVSLKQLMLLDGENNIYTLPDSICSLTQLESLQIDGCNLSHLPSEIGNLVSLKFLGLRGNNFCTLPDSIRNVRGLGNIILDNCAKLQSLPKLPACRVSAVGCTSLETIPFELDQLGLSLQCRGCNKLAENNFANSLLKQLHKSKGLAELKEVVDILVPTGGEVPIWFPYQGRGSYTMADAGLPICPDLQRPLFSNVTKESESVLQIGGKLGGVQGPNIPAPPVDLQLSYISFVVPPLVKQKMLGWLICIFLTGLAGFEEDGFFFLSMGKVICNKIEKDDRRVETRKVSTCQDQVWLVYTPQGYSGLHLEGGDEVEISIRSTRVAMANVNWGVDFIYEVDENITKTNENQEPLIQHTSAPYQDVSLPEDFSLANK